MHCGSRELTAVRAECRAHDRRRVLHRGRVAVALALEEVPLPATPVEWAFIEQFLGPTDIAGGQFALREGDTLGVRTILLTLKGLLGLRLFILDSRIAGGQNKHAANQTADRH